jgi:hypothetical protein
MGPLEQGGSALGNLKVAFCRWQRAISREIDTMPGGT